MLLFFSMDAQPPEKGRSHFKSTGKTAAEKPGAFGHVVEGKQVTSSEYKLHRIIVAAPYNNHALGLDPVSRQSIPSKEGRPTLGDDTEPGMDIQESAIWRRER